MKATALFQPCLAVIALVSSLHAQAQTFSSGSNTTDGAFTAPAGTTVINVKQGGVYHHTSFTIPAGRTVQFVRNAANDPVVILATGPVDISGTLSVSGIGGGLAGPSGVAIGGDGGPGGFNGGNGASSTIGIPSTVGRGPGGGAQGTASTGGHGGSYGASSSFVALIPLLGGSGGGGTGTNFNGASGGGGGGAILIASSSSVHVNGTIAANGGPARNSGIGCVTLSGGGSGGAIRIVAPVISGVGSLQAVGGTGTCGSQPSAGRIRLEAFDVTFNGGSAPIPSIAGAPGPVSEVGNPALTNVPTLAISSVGGINVPPAPAASYFSPDMALAPGTTNPVPVVLTATNTPVGAPTELQVRVIPQNPGSATSIIVPPTDHTGTFASSSATVNVTLPAGQVTVLQAVAGMTLTGQTASLFPQIDGEPVERVMVAASPGNASTLSLVTNSGREVRVDQLRPEQQLQVARAWQILKETRVE